MSWLVTGAAGFIGSHLVDALLELGVDVVALDNLSRGKRIPRCRFIRGDIRNPETCRFACEGVDVILHQAGLNSIPLSFEDPVTFNEVNVGGFLNMLIAAEGRRFVYASSSSVYGMLSPYAVSKKAAELYASLYRNTVGLRYFNVFGERQNPQYGAVIPRWVKAMKTGGEVEIYGDGEMSRDFTYVENVVRANLIAATTGSGVYDVGVGKSTTLNALFGMLKTELGFTGEPVYKDFRAGDVRFSQASEFLPGYDPIELEDGLALWLRSPGRTKVSRISLDMAVGLSS